MRVRWLTEPPTDYVASLCKPGKKCCFVSTATISVTQSSSVSAAQPQKFDSQFCVTTNPADAGQLRAVFSKARETRRADDISIDSPTGIDLVGALVDDVERSNIRTNIAQVWAAGRRTRRGPQDWPGWDVTSLRGWLWALALPEFVHGDTGAHTAAIASLLGV
jgi:hypothetical protein